MGGSGSTRWNGSVTRDTVEGHLCLNIFKLKNIIQPGADGQGFFAAGKGVMHFSLKNGALTMTYTINGKDMHYSIRIDQTYPEFGGARCWFLCPRCARRVAKLYLVTPRFECRHCNDLAYQSTRELTLQKIHAQIQREHARVERLCKKYGVPSPK